MKRRRPGILAVRAVNQYRRRDVLTYLALRYYLHNEAARSDQWAQQIASDLVLSRSDLPYFQAYHFKEFISRNDVAHRAMFLPSANEALAEAALLAECAKHPQEFKNLPCVFSYELSTGNDRSGIFPYYSVGLRERHAAIAKACDDFPDGLVRYIDIKRFYPSISPELALAVWNSKASAAGLNNRWRELGEKLIHDHSKVPTGSKASILTGPMFSHLIGNLVLRQIDDELSQRISARYFRYVDDITLVGSEKEVEVSLNSIRAHLANLGLEVHDERSPKSIRVSAQDWLSGRHDYQQSRRPISWLTFIGDLKRYLLANPGDHQHLHDAFRNEGFRVPVRDYSSAIFERSFLEQIRRMAAKRWFRRSVNQISIESLLKQARWLRGSFEVEFRELLDSFSALSSFERKRRIPKLRYRAGRLSYLATEDTLAAIAAMADSVSELHFQSLVMAATASGNIDRVIGLGTNAAQAAAQPMKAIGKIATLTLTNLSEAQKQALAVFRLNGVSVNAKNALTEVDSELLAFAEAGTNSTLMKSSNFFMREIACLHGISEGPRHTDILESVFDEDEDMAVDAVSQLQQSLSP